MVISLASYILNKDMNLRSTNRFSQIGVTLRHGSFLEVFGLLKEHTNCSIRLWRNLSLRLLIALLNKNSLNLLKGVKLKVVHLQIFRISYTFFIECLVNRLNSS